MSELEESSPPPEPPPKQRESVDSGPEAEAPPEGSNSGDGPVVSVDASSTIAQKTALADAADGAESSSGSEAYKSTDSLVPTAEPLNAELAPPEDAAENAEGSVGTTETDSPPEKGDATTAESPAPPEVGDDTTASNDDQAASPTPEEVFDGTSLARDRTAATEDAEDTEIPMATQRQHKFAEDLESDRLEHSEAPTATGASSEAPDATTRMSESPPEASVDTSGSYESLNSEAQKSDRAFDPQADPERSSDSPSYQGVPVELTTLPDGTDAIVIGHPQECADKAIGTQGGVPGMENDCGVVSCANVANEFGKDISEPAALQYAVDNKCCLPDGRTYLDQRERLLNGLDVDSVEAPVNSLEDIAQPIEDGKGEIIQVNAGELWQSGDPLAYGTGELNHAIQVTGVVRSPETGEILGFYVNDSGLRNNAGSGMLVYADTMRAAAFPTDANGHAMAGQNFANVTTGTWF